VHESHCLLGTGCPHFADKLYCFHKPTRLYSIGPAYNSHGGDAIIANANTPGSVNCGD